MRLTVITTGLSSPREASKLPEGPEVRRMGHDLSEQISGEVLESVLILSGRYTKNLPAGWETVCENLPMKIVGPGVHGKFLYILTDKGINIWSTLGMTGQWSSTRTKHSRISFSMRSGTTVFFNDQRNFGTIKFVYGGYALQQKFQKMGPDMFSDETTSKIFIERIRKKDKWNITKVLMNQSVLAGIGNYIKAEALWLSGISPLQSASDITDFDLVLLHQAIKDVMMTSYEQGGATFLTHKNFSGEPGDYSSNFLCYNRKIDAEGHRVVKTPTPDGRITHWAPDKQK